MAGILDKLRDMILDPEPLENDGMETDVLMQQHGDEVIETESDYDENPFEQQEKIKSQRSAKVVSMEKPNLTAVNGGGSIKMVLFQPISYEDSTAIVDNLRANKPVIVNMVDLERECAQRVLDFMAGAVYALNGTIRRVSYGIFVIVPSSVTIVGQGEESDRKLFHS